MAHFARLDENNVVIAVHVVNNETIDSANEETSGTEFLTQLHGEETVWKQTSYNKSFRKNYAGIGHTYDATRDAFIPPKPSYGEWVFDEETCNWNEVTK